MGRDINAVPIIPSSLRFGRKCEQIQDREDKGNYLWRGPEADDADQTEQNEKINLPSHVEGNQQVLMKRMFQVRLRRILRAYALFEKQQKQMDSLTNFVYSDEDEYDGSSSDEEDEDEEDYEIEED